MIKILQEKKSKKQLYEYESIQNRIFVYLKKVKITTISQIKKKFPMLDDSGIKLALSNLNKKRKLEGIYIAKET